MGDMIHMMAIETIVRSVAIKEDDNGAKDQEVILDQMIFADDGLVVILEETEDAEDTEAAMIHTHMSHAMVTIIEEENGVLTEGAEVDGIEVTVVMETAIGFMDVVTMVVMVVVITEGMRIHGMASHVVVVLDGSRNNAFVYAIDIVYFCTNLYYLLQLNILNLLCLIFEFDLTIRECC
eukprot:432120_1